MPVVGCASMREANDWTLYGICASGVAKPGSGAVPTTSSCGNTVISCASATATQDKPAAARAARAAFIESAYRHAPRQLADRDLGDLRIRIGVDDGDEVRAPARNVELPAVGCERHVPRSLADLDLAHDRVRRGIDDLHRSFAAGGHEHALAIRM